MNIIEKYKLKSRSSVARCSKLWDVDCRGTCVLLSLKKYLLIFNMSVKSMRYSICFQKHFRVYFINLMSGSIKVNKVVQKSWNLLYLLIWLMNWKPDLNIDLCFYGKLISLFYLLFSPSNRFYKFQSTKQSPENSWM